MAETIKDYCPRCGKPKTELFKNVAWRAYQDAANAYLDSSVTRACSPIIQLRDRFNVWWASELRDAQKRQRENK